MTNLDELLTNPPLREVPSEWRAQGTVTYDGITEVTTGARVVRGEELSKTDTDLISSWGYDLSQIEIVGTIGQWRKEQPDGSYLVSYNFRHRPPREDIKLPALYAELGRKGRKSAERPLETALPRYAVAVIADIQAGKVDVRGGSVDLLERLEQTRNALERWLKAQKPDRIVLMDGGDGVESFENTPAQAFTNDLSFPQQVDLYGTEILKFLKVCRKYAEVDVMAVPSNHGAWRNGKQVLGKPGDDWGIWTWRRVVREFDDSGVRLHVPDEWSEAVTFDADGTILGLTHGHQVNRPEQIPLWWAKQTHGGQPISQADVLVTAHFHHYRALPTGRNPYTGRSKWWLQAPTLDNGSSWWRNNGGDDSDPGMLRFMVGADGFELNSVGVL